MSPYLRVNTLGFCCANQSLRQFTKKNGCCSNSNSVETKNVWLKLEVSRHIWGTEGLTSRILALIKSSTLPSEVNMYLRFWKIGHFKYIFLWRTNDMLYWKCHPLVSINPKLITALPTARIPSVLSHAFPLHTWKLCFYKTHFQTSNSICGYILPVVSHFQHLSPGPFTHFNRCRCSLLPQFVLPKMSVKYHAMSLWDFLQLPLVFSKECMNNLSLIIKISLTFGIHISYPVTFIEIITKLFRPEAINLILRNIASK
jgi:hypothetical protein